MNVSAKRCARMVAVGLGGCAAGLFYLRRSLLIAADRRIDGPDSAASAEAGGRSTAEGAESAMSLKAVRVFFRHGARIPLNHVPWLEEVVYDQKFLIASVPYTEVPVEVKTLDGKPRPASELQAVYGVVRFKGGVTAGMLTTVGKDQMYLLGKRLAARYGNFVGKKFNPDSVYLRSTNVDRCIESLQCVLAGLFGHLSFKDPVLVRVEELTSEILVPSSYHCPRFKQLLKKSEELLEETQEYRDLVSVIQSYIGTKLDSIEDFIRLRDHIAARKAHGLRVPDFLEQLHPRIDRAAVAVLAEAVCGNIKENPTLGLSFAAGRLLNAVGSDLQALAKHGDQNGLHKFSLYSCHDSSLTTLLLALGCFDDNWPPYTADVAIELYEDKNSQSWVKVKYCEKDMILRGCETSLITLDRFLDVIQPYILTIAQYHNHCHDVARAVNYFNNTVAKSQTTEDYKPPPNI